MQWGPILDEIGDPMGTLFRQDGVLMGTRAGKSVLKADAQGTFIRLLYINVVADVLDK